MAIVKNAYNSYFLKEVFEELELINKVTLELQV